MEEKVFPVYENSYFPLKFVLTWEILPCQGNSPQAGGPFPVWETLPSQGNHSFSVRFYQHGKASLYGKVFLAAFQTNELITNF